MNRFFLLLLTAAVFYYAQTSDADAQVVIDGFAMSVDTSITINDDLTITGDIAEPGSLSIFWGNTSSVTDSVKNLVIDTYGSLAIGPQAELRLTGNFTQRGTFDAWNGSAIEFYGTSPQDYTGIPSLTTPYRFADVTVNSPKINLKSDMTLKPSGTFTFGNGGKKNIIDGRSPNTGVLVLEADATRRATITNYNTGAGSQTVKVDNNFVNGKIRMLTVPTTGSDEFEFPVGSDAVGNNTGLNLMKINFSPTARNSAGIRAVEAEFGKDAALPTVPDANACQVPNPASYTGVWEYKAFSDSAAATPVISFNNVDPNNPTNTYTLTLNPRLYSPDPAPARQNYSLFIQHANDPNFIVHRYYVGGELACVNYTASNQIVAPGITKFSKATAVQSGTDNSPFPVRDVTIAAQPGRDLIYVNWSLPNPSEVQYFIPERSTDGRNFTALTGNVNSVSGQTHYRITDRNVKAGTVYYYRLKMNTPVGETIYTRIVDAKLNLLGQNPGTSVSLYPNPTDGTLTLNVENGTEGGNASLKIVDGLGRTVVDKSFTLENAFSQVDLTSEITGLSAGTYNVIFTSENQILSAKVVKSK